MGQRDDSVFYEVYDGADGTGPVSQKQLTTIHRVTKGKGSILNQFVAKNGLYI